MNKSRLTLDTHSINEEFETLYTLCIYMTNLRVDKTIHPTTEINLAQLKRIIELGMYHKYVASLELGMHQTYAA